MPLVEASSYQAPFWLSNAHLQTIGPSYFMKEKDVAYEREAMPTCDHDVIYLDWARCRHPSPTKELMIISHGLCGSTHRHYVLSMVHALRRAGIDCLAWNYRGVGRVDNQTLKVTTNNSTNELQWVIAHAIAAGYEHIYLSGFSMGANLTMLCLGREAEHLPPQVAGAVAVCGTIDGPVCIQHLMTRLFGIYQTHFIHDLCRMIRHKHEQFPAFNIDGIDTIRTFIQFDDRFTATLMGFKDAQDYYVTSSACRWLDHLRLPALLINPTNDPFLGGQCYPVEAARKNPAFYLEMPADGGHCGFLKKHHDDEWWPAVRARQFLQENIRPALHLPPLAINPLEDL